VVSGYAHHQLMLNCCDKCSAQMLKSRHQAIPNQKWNTAIATHQQATTPAQLLMILHLIQPSMVHSTLEY
jgi:hypothetical protein